MRRFFNILTVITAVAFLNTNIAEAAKKNKKKKGNDFDISQVLTTTIEMKKGKKVVPTQVFCHNKKAGVVKVKKKASSFVSYKQMMSAIKDKKSKKYLNMKKLAGAAGKACKTATGATPLVPVTPPPSAPAPTPVPDYLSLEPYTGPFTEAHARMLYDRFGYSATNDQAAYAMQIGLAGTIDYMTTYVYEPDLEGKVGELNCDGEIEADGDTDSRACTANGVYLPGVRYGLYYRALHTAKPFFEKIFFFLHDERMTAGANFLQPQDLYTVIPHINLLRRAAITGDYVQFMKDWNDDHLGHRIWLDGGVNNGFSPNENYAREFWELGTVGPTHLDGVTPVYTDADIAQSALAFSGNWNAFHATGAKVIFAGTPYQATVENMHDVLAATFAHPRTAEHLAEDIWKEFINPYATPAAIQSLAQVIRDNNYNLIAVFRIIMASKAVFANESQKSLIKHPMEVIIGLMRSTGIHANYATIDSALSKMAQQPLLPTTVFGWDEKALAGEANVFDWRNAVGQVLSDTTMQTRRGFAIADLASLDSVQSNRADLTVDRVTRALNIATAPEARSSFVVYLDNELRTCSTADRSKYNCFPANNTYYRQAEKPLNPVNSDFTTKIKNLVIMAATLPDYRMK